MVSAVRCWKTPNSRRSGGRYRDSQGFHRHSQEFYRHSQEFYRATGGSLGSARPATRSGIAVYELLLALPVVILALLAVVVFGVLIANRQPLEMATRDGALVASKLDLPSTPTNVIPTAVKDAIDAALEEIGIDVATALANGTMHIRLEHTWDTASGSLIDPPIVLEEGSLVCPDPSFPPAPDPAASGRGYVRLTVCVRTDLLTPNLLSSYCIDMSDRVTAQTKTFRHGSL